MAISSRRGGNRDDRLVGTDDSDQLNGREGDDVIRLKGGDDTGYGRDDDDDISGGAGEDTIYGGAGRDRISGGTGADLLRGGKGADRFVFDPSRDDEGRDTIVDFALGRDKIELGLEDVLDATPDLEDEIDDIIENGGDAEALLEALDDAGGWGLRANAAGDLVIRHPNGRIVLEDVSAAGVDSFADLAGAISIRGSFDDLEDFDFGRAADAGFDL